MMIQNAQWTLSYLYNIKYFPKTFWVTSNFFLLIYLIKVMTIEIKCNKGLVLLIERPFKRVFLKGGLDWKTEWLYQTHINLMIYFFFS